jgi:hypothetical protein
MAKFAIDSVYDNSLDAIATATEMYVCVGQPATRAAAISTSVVAAITMAPGDFSKNTVSGNRVLTVAGKSVTATATGAVDHVALCSGSTLLYVTTAPVQTANSGAGVSVAGFTVTATDVV